VKTFVVVTERREGAKGESAEMRWGGEEWGMLNQESGRVKPCLINRVQGFQSGVCNALDHASIIVYRRFIIPFVI